MGRISHLSRVGQVETTNPFCSTIEQVMDPVNEKRQGLTHFLAHTYSHANIDLAVHTHPRTQKWPQYSL